MKKKAFSLIEVVFAISFLIMVGVAMTVLNSAASRLVAISEIKMTALGLNEQAISFVALEKRINGLDTKFNGYTNQANEYYVLCTVDQLDLNCSTSTTEDLGQFVGKSRLNFSTKVSFVQISGTTQYIVRATTAWGSGAKNVVTGQILE